MRINIGDRKWKLVFLPRLYVQEYRRKVPLWGLTRHDLREIRLDNTMTNRRKLEVVIHELLHACFPDLKEHIIDESAIDISKVLWALGYREKPDIKQ